MALKDEYSSDGKGYGLDEYGIEPQDDSRPTPHVESAGMRGPQKTKGIDERSVSEGPGKTTTTREM